MKRFFALLLILASVLSFTACGDKYPAVKSTEEEAEVVMTVEYDGEKYDIKYELYRALFVATHSEIDNGDISIWTSADKDKYIAEVDVLIKERIAEIYSIFHIAKKVGIDIYSKEYNETVKDMIAMSVEGGNFDGTEIEGFEGDYDKYLEYLKKQGINYSVQDLLARYYIAGEQVYIHYAGNLDNEEYLENIISGALKYTKEDIENFYYSDECVKIIRAYLPSEYYTEKRAGELRLILMEKAMKGEDEVVNFIISNSTAGASDIKNGEIVAKHNLENYYSELVKYAFELETFKVSPLIKIDSGFDSGYMIIYKTVKDSSHFEECYDQIRGVYIQNEVGKIIDTAADAIKNGLTVTDAYSKIDRTLILSE